MSKTKSHFNVIAASFAVITLLICAGTAGAQTIDDLAAMQRAKINDELRKSKGLPDSLQLAASIGQSEIKAPPPPPPRSGLAVHSLYTMGSNKKVAELSDGLNLFLAAPGRQYGPFRIVNVNEEGITVAPAGCKKKCAPAKLIRVGGSF